MTEKFITPGELPTPHERELLTILIEECAEVQQRATKALRFGLSEIQPGQLFTNKFRLGGEVGDLLEVIDRCLKAEVLRQTSIEEGRVHKRKQLDKYMQTEPEHS
jgi:hypothetical protein